MDDSTIFLNQSTNLFLYLDVERGPRTHPHANRLGVNFFFEPRFGSMQWPNSTGNFYAETAKQNKEHLAMRSLWFQSANHVWQKFAKGVPFHGWKMEII